MALGQGDWAAATPLFIESLGYNWQVRDYRGTAACLAALANWCIVRGRLDEAAGLFGSVAAFLEFIHTPLLLYDQQQYEQNTRRLQAQLDKTVFGESWARGHALTHEQAVEQARAVAQTGLT